ncbi:long-chain-fatty-acid--CoA ligase [Salinibacterium sp. SYSU T00001]|uniref:long-chain-fatty-acid--CoA ligase n=1 Tax=Homoserinimonas sedimenticola TaxID=2986805 RepID=UPI00223545EF|nr:long-chain-fatty-acid--CoA ligase [Salinibacterium sedimenticola]MCW4385603.1 long-chain-fatty-acid--CoA ligase [Salinibacterium sedimenticola]
MSDLSTRPWLSSYAKGVPHDVGAPSQTLVEMLAATIRRHGRRPALDFFGASLTYRELGEQLERVAGGLRKLGVKKGDRVALVLPNCPQHIVAFYAILRLGAIAVEHNPLYTARELRHQFEDHGATVAIVWDKVAASVVDFPDDVGVEHVVSVDVTRAMPRKTRFALRLPLPAARRSRSALTVGKRVAGTEPWEKLTDARPLRRSHPAPSLGDTAVLQYTSGTTGTPKGAVLTHANLRVNAMQGEAWVQGLRPEREVVYGVLPMFHAYGLTLCLTFAMSIGARLVLFPKFDEKLVLDAMKKTPATFLPAVPPIYARLAAAAKKKRVSLRGIRFAISGAMNLPVETVEAWEKATGGLLIEGYGMTETSPVAAGNPMGSTRRPGTVGVPFPSTEIRVVDPDDPATDAAEGELLVRGPQVFQGYWRRPDETRAALLPGGWLRTGDIVTVSGDGFITIVDRMKELIITGGFNVAPSEVEEALQSHPSVAEAAAVGLPSQGGGEDVAAAVVLAPGASLDVAGLREHCRRHLTAYKVPRTIVAVDELPRSMIGKVLRREVREQLLAR